MMRKVRLPRSRGHVLAMLTFGDSDIDVTCAGVEPEGVHAVLRQVFDRVWLRGGKWLTAATLLGCDFTQSSIPCIAYAYLAICSLMYSYCHQLLL
jgi:hypothetical protein